MQLSANIKTYWLLLKDLSNEEKRSLIELLMESLKTSAAHEKQELPKEDSWVDAFYGSWSDTPETAEELIQLIEGARTTGRPVETL